jgi:hypothetical protein
MFPSLPSGKPIKYLLIAAIALAIGCSKQPDNPPPTQTDLSESTASEPTPNNNDLVSAAVDATVEARAAANQALATAESAAETAIELTITAAIEATSTAR